MKKRRRRRAQDKEWHPKSKKGLGRDEERRNKINRERRRQEKNRRPRGKKRKKKNKIIEREHREIIGLRGQPGASQKRIKREGMKILKNRMRQRSKELQVTQGKGKDKKGNTKRDKNLGKEQSNHER